MGTPIDLKRFRRDLDWHRRRNDATTWTALAEQAGVSPAMFTRIRKGSGVTLEAFVQLCAAFHLDPIDYMPDIRGKAWIRNQNKPTKEQPMEHETKLSLNGKRFSIEDVDMRRSAAWANGPMILSAELPDGQTLGDVTTANGEWLWRLSGEEWQRPAPVEGAAAQYVDQDGREAAIMSLMHAIEDRYSVRPSDPWEGIEAAPDTNQGFRQTPDNTSVPDPWSPVFSDAQLPEPDPGIDQGMGGPATPGIGM